MARPNAGLNGWHSVLPQYVYVSCPKPIHFETITQVARNLYILRPLRKAISSQLALFSFDRLSLKTPIFEGEGTSNEEVVLRNILYRYMGTCVELYRMAKNAI